MGLNRYSHPFFQNIRPRGYKTFFMLNSAEHEICPNNKSQITNNCTLLSMKISLLINMKMPTIVGIFIFISRETFMLSWVEHEKFFVTLGPGVWNLRTFIVLYIPFFASIKQGQKPTSSAWWLANSCDCIIRSDLCQNHEECKKHQKFTLCTKHANFRTVFHQISNFHTHSNCSGYFEQLSLNWKCY